jgi:hypothetical protein
MVTKWGMGRDPEAREAGTSGRGPLGFLVVRPNGSLPSEVQASATRAIRALLDEAYAEACATLLAHMETLRRIAGYLVEHERLDGDTFDSLFENSHPATVSEAEWRPESARPRAWHEIPAFVALRSRPAAAAIAGLSEPAAPIPAALPAPAPTPLLPPVPADAQPQPVPVASRPAGPARGDAPRRTRPRTLLGVLTNRRIRPLPLPVGAVKLEKRVRTGAANTIRQAEAWLAADDSGAEANR